MVHDQLRQLLLEHDCVTLPGFGALLAEPVPARIHPVRHTLSPPARQVVFSERLRHDDGLLTAAVARSLATTEAGAAQAAHTAVRSFTEELRTTLRLHRAAELRGLGTLRQPTEADPIRFEALEPGYLPLAASFGLPELVSRPVALTDRARATRYVPDTGSAIPQLRPVPSRLRRLVSENSQPLYRLATAVVVALLVSATYLNFQLTPFTAQWLPGAEVAAAQAPLPQRAEVGTAEVATVSAPSPTVAVALEPLSAAPTPVVAPAPKRPPAPDDLRAPAAAAVPAASIPAIAEIAAPAAVPATAALGTSRTAPTGRYYLVWNAFTTKVKAEKGRVQVTKQGDPAATTAAAVLAPPPGSVLYRVTVADFATREEATAALPSLRARYGPALWVLRY